MANQQDRRSGAPGVNRSTSQLSMDAVPSGDINQSSSGFRSGQPQGAVPRASLQPQYSDSGIVQSIYTRSQGQITEASQFELSQICPSGTQSFQERHEAIVSSIYRNLETLEKRAQRVLEAKLEKIRKYFHRLPVKLKTGYFDVMILYSSSDLYEAEKYRDHLQSLEMASGRNVKAVLYDDPELESLPGSKFKHLEEAFKRCTFAFVFLTKEFCESEWCQLSSEECLMESIYNQERKWCVVPVYTIQRSKADFRVPMGLNSLKGVNYYNNDEFYKRGLRKLIGDKLYIRERHEQNLLDEQYNCAVTLEEEDRTKLIRDEKRIRQQRSYNPEHLSGQYGLQNQMSWPQSSSATFNTQDDVSNEFADSYFHSSSQPFYPESSPTHDDMSQRMGRLDVSSNAKPDKPALQAFTVSEHPQSSMPFQQQELQSGDSRIRERQNVRHIQNPVQPASLPNLQVAPQVHRSSNIDTISNQTSFQVPSQSGVEDTNNSNHSLNLPVTSGPPSLSGGPSLAEDHYPSGCSEVRDRPADIPTNFPDPVNKQDIPKVTKQSNEQAVVIHHHHYYSKPREKVINIVNAANVVVGPKGQIISAPDMKRVSDDEDDNEENKETENSDLKRRYGSKNSLDDESIDADRSTLMTKNMQGVQQPLINTNESTFAKENVNDSLTPRGSKVVTADPLQTTNKALDGQKTSPSPKGNRDLENISTPIVANVAGVQRPILNPSNCNKDDGATVTHKATGLATKPKREIHFKTDNTVNRPVVAAVKPLCRQQGNECNDDDDSSEENTFQNNFQQTVPKSQYCEETHVKSGYVDSEQTFVKQPAQRNSLRADSSLEVDGEPDEIDIIKEKNLILDPVLSEDAVLTADDRQISAVQQLLAMDYAEKDIKCALETLRRSRPGHTHFSINNMLDILEMKEAAAMTTNNPSSGGDAEDLVPCNERREYSRQRSVSEENLNTRAVTKPNNIHKSASDLNTDSRSGKFIPRNVDSKEKCTIS